MLRVMPTADKAELPDEEAADDERRQAEGAAVR
jgi:hypothetical protein